MTKKISDGGPAFPPHPDSIPQGMSLRDWFAGQALTGIMGCARDYRGYGSPEGRVKLAYETADAMLKEREAGHE